MTCLIPFENSLKDLLEELLEDCVGDLFENLVERFVQKKDSPLARQGRLIEPDRFFGLANLEAYERYTKKSRELKMTSYSFGDVVHTIQHSPSSLDSEFFGFEENPNAIYFNRNTSI